MGGQEEPEREYVVLRRNEQVIARIKEDCQEKGGNKKERNKIKMEGKIVGMRCKSVKGKNEILLSKYKGKGIEEKKQEEEDDEGCI